MADGRILLVDDDQELLSLFADALELDGVPTSCAGDGEQAFGLLLERSRAGLGNFHAIVSDWKMPVLDGLELLTRVRSSRFHGVPFVLISGAVTADVLRDALRYDPDAVLLKPFHIDALHAKIREAVDVRGRKERDRARIRFASTGV
jgi:DNA-binding response OmpR family regulator